MDEPDEPTGVDPVVRRLAESALLRYDLGEHRLVALAESFNTVFRVDTRAARLVLRVGPTQRVHPVDAVRGEARWTNQLAAHGLQVPQLVPAGGGVESVRVASDDGCAERECSVWTWVPGEPMTRPPSGADVRQLADLSARLHEATPPLAAPPPHVLTAGSVRWFDVPDRLADLPHPHREVLLVARDRAQQAIDRLWQSADTPPRVVHGDLTPSNVVRHDGELFAIDCQDLAWGHVEQDLAHSIYGVTRGVDLADGLAAFRSGYERRRPWPRLDLALLTDLVVARRVSMVNLAMALRRPGLDVYVERHADALRRYPPAGSDGRPR